MLRGGLNMRSASLHSDGIIVRAHGEIQLMALTRELSQLIFCHPADSTREMIEVQRSHAQRIFERQAIANYLTFSWGGRLLPRPPVPVWLAGWLSGWLARGLTGWRTDCQSG